MKTHDDIIAYRYADHLGDAFRDRKRVVRLAAAFIRENPNLYAPDVALVGIGISGTVMATSLADALNMPLCIVRKACDDANSFHLKEGALAPKYILIDDLIDTGNTVNRVIQVLDGDLIQIILYHDYDGYSNYNGIPIKKI